jgi:carbon starvation protein
VAIMALIAAASLHPGVYFAMNSPAAIVGSTVQDAATAISQWGFVVTPDELLQTAKNIGETTVLGRAGGAPTLAVGMANIFSKVFNGAGLGLWYHFAIMFEALFILTTLDAGTRVGRYLLQDFLEHIWKPLGDTKKMGANFFASALMVGAWGYFLIQGVRDPLGGINSLWPLFGIANQILAAIALCLAVTIILKMQLAADESSKSQIPNSKGGKPALALIAFVPLVWLLVVTMTAGVQKIWHPNPKIGFLAAVKNEQTKINARAIELTKEMATSSDARDEEMIHEMSQLKRQRDRLVFNYRLDSVVTGIFLTLITAIVLISVREWILLLAHKKVADLRETPPTWLPEYALAQARPMSGVALLALAFALVKELSGEAELDRARQAHTCACDQKSEAAIYSQVTEERFKGVRRCC